MTSDTTPTQPEPDNPAERCGSPAGQFDECQIGVGDEVTEVEELIQLHYRATVAGLHALGSPPQSDTTAPGPDKLLTWFRNLQHRIRDEIDTYAARADGTEDPGSCADHHDRLEALYAEAADTMATLDNQLCTGAPLPTAWNTAPR
ncbi:hypothetical protein [Nocardia jinanensis]|uniref:Uncharacterized protein n=1 Tax=Nocardia jinanensis TaxID=382504 RepID=A0A917RRD1_9NOCA|nr:hypothetical protein [Nocardia jinanensis]GGL20600.1 hypothetical protein GCM10011588_39280 [Nocardia jinanensis]